MGGPRKVPPLWDDVGYNQHMQYVYILKGKSGQRYIGCTNDLKRRLQEHNYGSTRTTSNNGPYYIIWYCAFQNSDLAHTFEKYLKSSSGYAFTKKHFSPS